MNIPPSVPGMGRNLTPVVYPLSTEIRTVFPAPFPSTVATVEIDNRVTFLHLGDDVLAPEPEGFDGPEHIRLDIGVVYPFPPVRGRLFGYAQKRMLIFFDSQRREGYWHVVCPRLEEVITRVHLLEPGTFTLLLDIRVAGEPGHSQRLLRTVPMGALLTSSGTDLLLGPCGSDYAEPVAVAAGNVFRYVRSAHRIEALGPDLGARPHPFCALFENKRQAIRLPTALALHPRLPFAVVVDRSPVRNEHYVIHLAMWDSDEPRIVPLPLAGVNRDGLYCSGFEFSPDGAWLVFRDETEDELEPVFIGLPVISDKPPYVGPAVTLGKTLGGPPTCTCWIADPRSFVACDGGALYRWMLA